MQKAFVLAAGYGSRLGAITKEIPKCLVEAGGKTLLAHTLDRLKGVGVTDVVINLYHLGHLIEAYLKQHDNFGLNIQFSREPELLGTGGGLKAAKDLLVGGAPFYIHNSDLVSDIDLAGMSNAHLKRNALVTLAVQKRATSRPLLFSSSGLLMGWERSEHSEVEMFGAEEEVDRLAFTGVQIVSPQIFEYCNMALPFSTIPVFMAAARAGERVCAFRADEAFWIDAGTPDALAELRVLLSKGEALN